MTIMYHMLDKINYVHSKILLHMLAIPLLVIISACGNKGPLTVPQEKLDSPIEQQETTDNSY